MWKKLVILKKGGYGHVPSITSVNETSGQHRFFNGSRGYKRVVEDKPQNIKLIKSK